MFDETHVLESSTGAHLAYYRQPAEGTARGILLICHGLAEHARRYARFAKAMAGHGYHVYAHDHRGHGKTRAPDAPLGRFAAKGGVDAVIADVKAMRDHAAGRDPGLPVLLFGHSMGGLISLNTVVTYPDDFAGAAVWNSNFAVGALGRVAQGILAAERMMLGSDVPSALLPKLTFEAWGKSVRGHRTPFDWLSSIPEEVDAYIADPLCGFGASVALWQDVFDMTYRAMKPERLSRLPQNFPLNLVGGGQDPATDHGKAVEWLANRLKNGGYSRITSEIYRNARHETLNDVVAETATSTFAAWCGRLTAEA